MATNLRPERASIIIKFLMETKKSYSMDQLAAEFKWSRPAVDRSMQILIKSGVVNVDKARSPWYYSWKKGSQPNIYPIFHFTDEPQVDFDIRTPCNNLFSATRDWKLPVLDKDAAIIYALIFGLGLDESDDAERYEAYVNTVAARFRQHYLAYRLACSFIKLQRKERGPKALERLGINWKREDDESNLPLLLRDKFTELLEENA